MILGGCVRVYVCARAVCTLVCVCVCARARVCVDRAEVVLFAAHRPAIAFHTAVVLSHACIRCFALINASQSVLASKMSKWIERSPENLLGPRAIVRDAHGRDFHGL